jgi:hypothetical protein
MDQHDKYIRRAAAAAFSESLDQLEERLLSDDVLPPSRPSTLMPRTRSDSPPQPTTRLQPPRQSKQSKHLSDQDLQAFADAAEEIEEFIQARH